MMQGEALEKKMEDLLEKQEAEAAAKGQQQQKVMSPKSPEKQQTELPYLFIVMDVRWLG